MIKLFGGGGRFAKQHPELLLLNQDDERETGSAGFIFGAFQLVHTKMDGFLIYTEKNTF